MSFFYTHINFVNVDIEESLSNAYTDCSREIISTNSAEFWRYRNPQVELNTELRAPLFLN